MSCVDLMCLCLNNVSYITNLVDTIVNQTFDNIHVIFVDGGSTDGSLEKIQELSKKITERGYSIEICTQKGKGVGAGYETGLRKCKSDYVIQTDCDDIIEPNAIEKMATFLDEHNDVSIVRVNGHIRYVDENNREAKFTDIPHLTLEKQLESHLCDSILNGDAYLAPPCSYMYRLCAMDDCNPERRIEHSMQGQNYQVLIPLTYHFLAGYIDECLFYYIVRGDSTTRVIQGNPESELWSIDESADLIYKVLIDTGADEKYAKRWKIHRRDKLRLNYAFKYRDKRMAVAAYSNLREYNLLDGDDKKNYYSTKYLVVRCARNLKIRIGRIAKV